MWLHGIPGAGKTILCSTIIEHIKALHPIQSANRYAYFYFDFNDARKQTVAGMLSSLIAQLCVSGSHVPSNVHELYKQCKGSQPSMESLFEILLSLLTSSHQTYLIMDALDESSEREDLLDVITRIIQMPLAHVNLLVTSRKERDITDALYNIVDAIGLEGHQIDADICLHVQNCLKRDKRLCKWPPSIKDEIQNVLTQQANGM